MFPVPLMIVQTVGAMAMCVVLYSLLQRNVRNYLLRCSGIGLVFGIGTALVMMQPISLGGAYHADATEAFIGMAAAFGGPAAALIASAFAFGTRLQMGGEDALYGCGLICLTVAAALSWYFLHGREAERTKYSWFLICLATAIPSSLGSLASGDFKLVVFVASAALAVVSILIFGKMLETEQHRVRREQTLASAASTDSLTGLPNRRAFEDFVHQLEESRAHDVLLLLVDVDHFKRINDLYGHDEGDNVLREIGLVIKEETRRLDFSARIGGEEFAVLIKTSEPEIAESIAERLRNVLQISYGDPTHPLVTNVSIGAFHSFNEPFNYKGSYKAADQALYQSKTDGRNRVTFNSIKRPPLSIVSA